MANGLALATGAAGLLAKNQKSLLSTCLTGAIAWLMVGFESIESGAEESGRVAAEGEIFYFRGEGAVCGNAADYFTDNQILM